MAEMTSADKKTFRGCIRRMEEKERNKERCYPLACFFVSKHDAIRVDDKRGSKEADDAQDPSDDDSPPRQCESSFLYLFVFCGHTRFGRTDK